MEDMIMKQTINPDKKALMEAILSLESVEECEAFLDDLCTIKEVQDLTQRYAVARMLDKGDKYQIIEEMTGASTATISRVKRSLSYGSGGYLSVIAKANKKQ
jgi:TrpR-related protein YerC/YecD